jgi:hypothetical protein
MPGIYSHDHYSRREGMVRILKMANEALLREEGACYALSTIFVNPLHLPVEEF